MSDTPAIIRLADDAQTALRELAHLTIRGAVPAPVLYEALGHLKQIGPTLAQTLQQLGDGLTESLRVFDVVEDDGADPLMTTARCCHRIRDASINAARLGAALEDAQAAIAHQGYRTRRREPRPRRDPPPSGRPRPVR